MATFGPAGCTRTAPCGSTPRLARPSNISCPGKPTCAASSSTIRRRRRRSGPAAITAPLWSRWNRWTSITPRSPDCSADGEGAAGRSDNNAGLLHRICRLVMLAIAHKLASVFTTREFVEAGGLLSYGPDRVDLFRRGAIYVDKVLKGAKPADLPVQQPTKYELVTDRQLARPRRAAHAARPRRRGDRVSLLSLLHLLRSPLGTTRK